jgi:hypothetical protein
MSITTLAELKTALDTETSRSDITWNDYITRGETRLNRKLRLLQQETDGSLTLSSGNDYVSLPSDFIAHKDLYYTSDNWQPIQLAWPALRTKASTASGRPDYYAIGDKIYFERDADQNYTLKQHYFKRWDLATDNANWLLTNAPDAYIYSALMAFNTRAKNTQAVVENRALLEEVVDELNMMDGRTRSRVKMVTEFGGASFDINRG